MRDINTRANIVHNLTYTQPVTRIYFAFSFMFGERVAATRCIHSISEFIYFVPCAVHTEAAPNECERMNEMLSPSPCGTHKIQTCNIFGMHTNTIAENAKTKTEKEKRKVNVKHVNDVECVRCE